ncbi:MAG TPA: hypothetical protein VIK35_12760, partial [Verrucomicrobiae bacterium]
PPPMVLPPLKAIWLASGQLCSKLLKAALPEWLGCYEQTYGQPDPRTRQLLLAVRVWSEARWHCRKIIRRIDDEHCWYLLLNIRRSSFCSLRSYRRYYFCWVGRFVFLADFTSQTPLAGC